MGKKKTLLCSKLQSVSTRGRKPTDY